MSTIRLFVTFPNQDETSDVLYAFADYGIQLNKRTRHLVPLISANEVNDVYRKLYSQGKHKETGILITILEDQAQRMQRLTDQGQSRYANWEQ